MINLTLKHNKKNNFNKIIEETWTVEREPILLLWYSIF